MARATIKVIMLILAAGIALSVAVLAHSGQSKLVPVVRAVAPAYPTLVPIRRIEDRVHVYINVEINEQGSVTSARADGGLQPFALLAERAARHWEFSPSEDGTKTRTAQLRFIFRMMPANTPTEDLGTVFTSPYEVEIRTEHFEMPKGLRP